MSRVEWPSLLPTGEAAFSFPGGGGGDRALRPDPPPQKGSIDRTPKILPRLTPRASEVTQTQSGFFLESARRGGSEKSSFAILLVKKNRPILMIKKIFGAFAARLHND